MPKLRFGLAILAYLLFFASFLYLVGFVGDVMVPRSIDSAPGEWKPTGVALATNVGLIALFGLQHSLMARPDFKKALTENVPQSFERTIYVLASVAVLVMIFLAWQPMPQVVWAVTNEAVAMVLWGLFAIGWLIVFISTWLVNHFELFGLQQAWYGMRGEEPPAQQFREPLFYKATRHPLYLGFLIAFWAIPTMTLGHLVFAIGMTVYVLIAIRYEERDLTEILGEAYADYRRRVGMLIPGIGKAKR